MAAEPKRVEDLIEGARQEVHAERGRLVILGRGLTHEEEDRMRVLAGVERLLQEALDRLAGRISTLGETM